MNKKTKLVGILVALVVIIGLGGCSLLGGSNKDTGNLQWATSEELNVLSPRDSTSPAEVTILKACLEGLVNISFDGEPIGAVATSWEVSEDGKNYLFYLDEEKHWSDGTKITTDDFVTAWKLLLEPEELSPRVYDFYPVKNALNYALAGQDDFVGSAVDWDEVGIKAVDEHILAVELEKPLPEFPALVALSSYLPLPSYLEELPRELIPGENGTPTNGHYRPLKFNEKEAVLEKSPLIEEELRYNKITVKHYAETELINAVNKNKIDLVTGLNKEEAEKNKKGYTLVKNLRPGLLYFSMNTYEGPLADENLRRALLAETVVAKLLSDFETVLLTPADRLFPLESIAAGKGYVAEYDAEIITEDLPPLRLMIREGDFEYSVAEQLALQWQEKLGLSTEIIVKSDEELHRADYRTYDLVQGLYYARTYEPLGFYRIFTDPIWQLANKSLLQDEEYKALYASAVNNPSVKGENMEKMDALLVEKAPFLPLFFETDYALIPSGTKNMPLVDGELDLVLLSRTQ